MPKLKNENYLKYQKCLTDNQIRRVNEGGVLWFCLFCDKPNITRIKKNAFQNEIAVRMRRARCKWCRKKRMIK